ncbi:MAG: hypothetical protein ACK55I_26875 [bacterium]
MPLQLVAGRDLRGEAEGPGLDLLEIGTKRQSRRELPIELPGDVLCGRVTAFDAVCRVVVDAVGAGV